MAIVYYTLAIIGIVALWLIVVHRRAKRVRAELMRKPVPPEWEEILAGNVTFYRSLPEDLKHRLHGYMHVFLTEKHFEACGGLEELTDEICVTIAAQACVLLLNDRNGCFDRLQTILVYPRAFYVDRIGYNDDGLQEAGGMHLGESWSTGSVVLSWESVLRGGENDDDGMNVVIHEFAHQLDQLDGAADGAPMLSSREDYARWSRVMGRAYGRHVRRTDERRRTVMDKYGATNPAEFFAVATETFFEKPRILRRKYPALYNVLRDFYELDPAKWGREANSA